MKKFICFISIILLCSVYVIPTSAVNSKEAGYGSYHNFDFSQGGIYTDYTVNARKNCGELSYIPLASDGQAAVSYASINNKDALRLRTTGLTTLVPLKGDGTPFVMEAGKSYTVNFTMVVKRSSSRWSRCVFTPYADINGVKAASMSGENVISYVKNDTSEKSYGQRSLYGPGAKSSQWMYFDWKYTGSHTKLPAYSKGNDGFTAATGFDTYEKTQGETISFNKVITIKSDAEMEGLGVTVNTNGTYERNGVTYNNFFAIEFPGASNLYTPGENADAFINTKDADGNAYYQLFSDYYITKLEIVSEDYVATTELYNGEEKLATVVLDNGYMKSADMVFPTVPYGKYFSGWYYDKECTRIYDGKDSLVGISALYAGFQDYKNSLSVSFENFNPKTDQTVRIPNNYTEKYKGYIASDGYAPKSLSNGNMLVTTGGNSYGQNKETLKYSSWGQNNLYIIRHENGQAYRINEGYIYTIKMKYKVDEIGKNVSVGGGYGIPVSYADRSNYANDAFTYNLDTASYTETTDGFVEYKAIFKVEDGMLDSNFAVAGMRFKIGGCNIDADTGEIYSQGKILVESISIEGFKAVNCNLEYNGGRPYRFDNGTGFSTTKTVSENKAFESFPAYKDGCKFAGWFIDEDLTQTAEGTLFRENATYYAKWLMYGDCDSNNNVDAIDLACIKRYLAGIGEVDGSADCDDDGKIDAVDLANLKIFLAGIGTLGPQVDDWRTHPQDFKLIAFTFDDAPSYSGAGDNATTKIIDTLYRYEGAGTLFINGNTLEYNGTGLLEYALENGFELGNHTYSHPKLPELTKDGIREEIVKVNDMVYKKLGVTLKYMRPGYGAVNSDVYDITTELGMPVILWNGTSGDTESGITAEGAKNKILSVASDGGIILCHGWSDVTAEALEDACYQLYAEGYRFVTVSELFKYKGINFSDIPTDRFINSANF